MAGPLCMNTLAYQRKTSREIDTKDMFLFYNKGHP